MNTATATLPRTGEQQGTHRHGTACPIMHLPGLHARARNQLIRFDILTIGELAALNERAVRDIRRIGQTMLDNIIGALDAVGMTLAGGAR